jgi:hypothetical protein
MEQGKNFDVFFHDKRKIDEESEIKVGFFNNKW